MKKRVKREASWETPGRDLVSLEMLLDMYADGYEFIVQGGHIVSVLLAD